MYCQGYLRSVIRTVLVVSPVLLFAACGGRDDRAIKMKGSDTVLPIGQSFAESFAAIRPEIEVSVTGGGSGVGIAALLSNTTDIAMASRDIKISEKLRLQERNMPFQKRTIAYDALAVVVHPANPVRQLTREQLEAIYTGKVKNWRAVGGADEQIVVYSRESSSGTHEFFKEAVLNGREFASDVLMMPATGAVIQSVSQTPGAIGYVGLAYVNPEVRALAVSYDQGKTYVAPSVAAALDETYPIVRPLFFLYLESKTERLQPFLQYVFSNRGQAEVAEEGFIPVTTSPADSARASR